MSNEQVILSSYQQEIGSVEENLASSFYKGEPLTISFSCKYASDAIKSFSGDKIKILFTGEMKPSLKILILMNYYNLFYQLEHIKKRKLLFFCKFSF